MDWKDAVAEVAKYAPAVATAIGGPPAGGITQGAADFVTGLLGVENSPAGLVAATQDPDKRAELVRINNDHKRKLEQMRLDAQAADAAEQTARLAETQKTMRAELEHEGWFKSGWRYVTGYSFALSLTVLALVLAYSIFEDPSLVAKESVTGMVAWLVGTMGATVGVSVREWQKDRARQMGYQPGSLYDMIKKKQ